MKKKANNSPKNNNDEQILALTEIQKAQIVLDRAKEQQRIKQNDPNYTAVIIREDNKTSRLKWLRTDKVNKEIGL